jgi:hypothetical protein
MADEDTVDAIEAGVSIETILANVPSNVIEANETYEAKKAVDA